MGEQQENHTNVSGDSFRLGDCLIHPQLNRVWARGRIVQLEPKVMNLLAYLAERPGQVCSRRELLEEVWNDVVVGEEVLTRAVSELRRCLDDDHRAPRFVETISRRGYRLVAAVSPATERWELNGEPGSTWKRRGMLRKAVLIGVPLAVGALWLGLRLTSLDHRQLYGEMPPYRVVPFTTYQGTEGEPAVSPDGTKVAFAWDGSGRQNVDVYVKQINVETPLRLTDHPGVDSSPAWSPDGTEVAYIHRDAEGAHVFAVPAIGGERRRLVPPRDIVGRIDWSPDGRTIAFAERIKPGRTSQIVLYDLTTGKDRVLTKPGKYQQQDDMDPVFSPDGSMIAFARLRAILCCDIYVMTCDGNDLRRVGPTLTSVLGLDWERDSRSLVCSGIARGFRDVWRVEVDDGGMNWLPGIGRRVSHVSVARHSRRMVYQQWEEEANIARVRLDAPPAEVEPLIVSSHEDMFPCLSSDGSEIAFVSSRSGSYEVWVCDSDGSRPFQLTSFEECFVAAPRWSPDQRRIALGAQNGQSMGIYVVERVGGTPQRVTDPQTNAIPANWSRDGKWLYFSSNQSGDWELWKANLDDPHFKAIRVTFGGGCFGFESLDGRYFYHTRNVDDGLWRRPVSSRPDSSQCVRALGGASIPGGAGRWFLCEQGVLTVDQIDGERWLVLLELEAGTRRLLVPVAGEGQPVVTASSDGNIVLLETRAETVGDLVLVEGF